MLFQCERRPLHERGDWSTRPNHVSGSRGHDVMHMVTHQSQVAFSPPCCWCCCCCCGLFSFRWRRPFPFCLSSSPASFRFYRVFFYRVSTFFLYVTFSTAFSNVPHLHQVVPSFPNVLLGFYVFFSSNRLKSIYTQFYRVFPCLTGFLRFFSNFYRVLLRFTEFYRVSPRLAGHFFTCFLISTEFCYVLPGSTEFYRVFVQFHVML